MMPMMRITVSFMLLLLVAGPLAAGQEEERNPQEEAAYRLEIAQAQYEAGDYKICLQTLDGYIADHTGKTFVFPHAQMARVYRLRALLAYAFRGEDNEYREEVRNYLQAALEEDPEVELGSPSEIPVSVQEMFYQVKEEYLEGFSRTSRRFTLGILGALIIDPTLLTDPSFLQPGITFSYNLSEHWSLNTDLQIPLSLPIWDAIRGQVGFSWYPDFSITRINTAIAIAYAFSLDKLETYTHSLSIAGQAERISRMGLGVGVRVEVLRLDLILGSFDSGDIPTYRSISLFGESAFRASYANMSFFVTYTF